MCALLALHCRLCWCWLVLTGLVQFEYQAEDFALDQIAIIVDSLLLSGPETELWEVSHCCLVDR